MDNILPTPDLSPGRLPEQVPEAQPPEAQPPEAQPPEEQFLQITLNGDLPLLLSVANLVEIMTLSLGQVVPMFQMPPWVMGLYNWRGDMLWVVDVGHFLGFAPWYQQPAAPTRQPVVVIKPPSGPTAEPPPTLGLVVSAVEAMVTYPTAALQLAPAALQPIPLPLPYLRGYGPAATGPPRPILDGTAVLTAMAQVQS